MVIAILRLVAAGVAAIPYVGPILATPVNIVAGLVQLIVG